MRRRCYLWAAAWLYCLAFAPSAHSQDHASHGSPAHRHPPGVKIIIDGTLLEPVCAFAASGTPQAEATPQTRVSRPRGELPPVLLGFDETLDLLHAADGSTPNLASLLNQRVVVRGTVYPAGSGYIILVDSLERDEASTAPAARACPA